MRARASDDWRVTVSSKPGGTRLFGVLALALGIMLVIAAGGTVLTDPRDWPAAALFVVVGGLFGAVGDQGLHWCREEDCVAGRHSSCAGGTSSGFKSARSESDRPG